MADQERILSLHSMEMDRFTKEQGVFLIHLL